MPGILNREIITWKELEEKISIDVLLKNFLELDPALIKADAAGNLDEKDATSKKFTNFRKGVPSEVRIYLTRLAAQINSDSVLVPEHCRLGLADIFVLLSNHLDQQNTAEINPMLADTEKEATVLRFLRAAAKLNPVADYNKLEKYSCRYLSSHAQMLFYLGKALRYHETAPEDRGLILERAIQIETFLRSNYFSAKTKAEEDVHFFQNRTDTYPVALGQYLRNSQRFEEAAKLIEPQLTSPSLFHRVMIGANLSEIYLDAFNHQKGRAQESKHGGFVDHNNPILLKAFGYAIAAIKDYEEYEKANPTEGFKTNVKYNALLCRMKAELVVENTEAALETAKDILNDYETDKACGALPRHISAAKEVVEEFEQNLSLSC